jgi:stalled ribosome alternative rescue factor ArfA
LFLKGRGEEVKPKGKGVYNREEIAKEEKEARLDETGDRSKR